MTPISNPPDIDFPRGNLKLAATRWTIPGWNVAQSAPATPANGRIYYQPIFVSQNTTYIRIGCRVTTLEAARSARLSIYEWNSGLPGNLVLDAGTVSLAAVAYVEIVISQLLARGFYFLSIVTDSTGVAQIQAVATPILSAPIDGYYGVSDPIPVYVVLYKDGEVAQVAGGSADPAAAATNPLGPTSAFIVLREN